MPTSANKDIVDSKYSAYGENNMIIEGFVSEHEHHTEKTNVETTNNEDGHSHEIKVTEEGHEQHMDCHAIEDGESEWIELVPKPIPNVFNKDNKVGFYIFLVIMCLIFLAFCYGIISYIWNKLSPENYLPSFKTGN